MIAKTLSEAIDVLTGAPLDEAHSDWYVPAITTAAGGRPLAPLALFRARMLRATDSERLFLSGHIGSGKSTELRRLVRDPEVLKKFFVIDFELRPSEVPTLTSHLLLFIIAAEIYRKAKAEKLLGKRAKRWEEILKEMDDRLFGASGVTSKEVKVELEFDLLFVKMRQELSLNEARRVEFRKFAESEGTILVDLINALVDDVTYALAAGSGSAVRLLIVIDEPDKIRRPEQIDEIFRTNLGALRAPQVPMVLTIPASVTFGGSTTELGANVTHLRPIQVLQKTDKHDPMQAIDAAELPYMRKVFAKRVAPGLFDPSVIDTAAIYSGGVLRSFFDLLRDAAIRANDLYSLSTVDMTTFYDTLVEAKNALARGVFPKGRKSLSAIRTSHDLADPEDLLLLNTSLVLEYNHQGIWWEANPLLWETLRSE